QSEYRILVREGKLYWTKVTYDRILHGLCVYSLGSMPVSRHCWNLQHAPTAACALMNLVKLGKLEAGITVATDKHGREHVLVVAKQTFTIGPYGSCELAGEQQPLVYADEFHGESGMSATLYESDFALFKPHCDVLLNGSAYAPNDVPVES